ncbi:MAG: 4a-hydroxytetrahydrobiopterin dehydratase [Hahellaceae bacterium]|nr:4a-hydroxytetrahydrobiopterin dehydratase [Hahellaceae bacterium]MCP5211940.1 4a-hydroxytetrahydrobiopterin dehydratase [Hahellaceae bacterium]
MRLADEVCEVCRLGAPQVEKEEAEVLLVEIPDWSIVVDQGVSQLQRVFGFSDFLAAMAFANRVAELAESVGHHPALLVEWGSVKVSWWTHKIKGLHKTDFVMAARTDNVFRG